VVPVYAAALGAGDAPQHRYPRIRIAKDRAPEKSAAREAAPAPEVNVVRGRGSAHLALLARHRHLSQGSTIRDWVLLRRAVVGRLKNCCISGIFFRIPRNKNFDVFLAVCWGSMTCWWYGSGSTDPCAPLTSGSGSCYFSYLTFMTQTKNQ
jgi:hypothetical protein